MLYVQVLNEEVKQVIDTIPADGVGNNGWKEAIEVRPAITAHRQGYTAHTFDLTKTPVEIVWGVYDIPVEDRKAGMKANATFEVQQLLQGGLENLDIEALKTAKDSAAAKQALIDAATTHDELDAITL